VRLFAKGFKDERNLIETKSSVADSDLDTYTSFDANTGNYYMWLVQRGLSEYQLSVDLSSLKIEVGTPITAETVNGTNYGEVTEIISLPNNSKFNFTLAPQSVVLLTIPSNVKQPVSSLSVTADATVKGGKNGTLNFGSEKQLNVQLDASDPSKNQVAYVQFDIKEHKPAEIKRAVFAVNGRAETGNSPYRLHVYAIPYKKEWDQKKISWSTAPYLDNKEALIKNVGEAVFIAGEIAFDQKERYHYLDVTEILKRHGENALTFVLVRETRQLGDDEDKNRRVNISASESGVAPKLQIWK
jgi:hypothetical protein